MDKISKNTVIVVRIVVIKSIKRGRKLSKLKFNYCNNSTNFK